MLAIFGGTYTENCLHPDWQRTFGSGARAAQAVSDLVDEVHLFTCAAASEIKHIRRTFSDLAGISFFAERNSPIEFQYEHSAGTPRLYPDYRDLTKIASRSFDEAYENVLLFSFIELESFPKLSAQRLVYDPQAGSRAVPFSRTGCHADELALVLNRTEAEAIATQLGYRKSAQASPQALAEWILRKEKAHAVVIKNNIFGAFVVTADQQSKVIPSFKTDAIFAIGSGDIFSGTFAAFWAHRRKSALVAAEMGSVANAYYAQNKAALPLPPGLQSLKKKYRPMDTRRLRSDGRLRRTRRPLIYLAGPFFNISQRWLINEAFRGLRSIRLDVWSPSAEAGILPTDASYEAVADVVKADLLGIQSCDCVFAILEGMDPGTLFEVGYAARLKKPVIAFAQTPVAHAFTMLEGTGADLFSDFATALYHTGWKAHGL